MENNKSYFNALTPEILDENKSIYNEALDYAFGNDEIKNIAITGIYGAGKSSVWKTYATKKNISNCITVSLGKYDDSEIKERDIGLENRLERQLIHQMLSQIKATDIPLSKYKFKKNIEDRTLKIQVFLTIVFIISILLWFVKESIISSISIYFNQYNAKIIIDTIIVALFIIPIVIYLFRFYKENKVSFSKINLNGTEANFKEEKTDETVLDRDIKEIVYLLNSSKCSVIVFEDIDRYENAKIFAKLRELNFLLNSFIKSNGEERIVKFVYMIKDSLFFSKNRTKFFDFILPIIPVVDSKTSENKLIELLNGIEKKPDDNVIANISLYIDDMRLLKNVVNEYIVYSNVIPLEDMDLNTNNLFALITLKNVFPHEFDLLQEDKGYIRSLFDKLEIERITLISKYQTEIENIKKRISFIENKVAEDKFELMCTVIPVDVYPYNSNSKTWSEYLMDWSKNPNDSKDIRRSGSFCGDFSYNEFVDKFVLTTTENKKLMEQFPHSKEAELNKLYSEIDNLKHKINEVGIYKYKNILSELSTDKLDELFSPEDNEMTQNHHFSLIRYLIIEGLIDETYWYYKGNFVVENSKTLKRNDMLYMKNLLEAKKQDLFLEVETPLAIIKRLEITDFNRFNILNKNILETCIKENLNENIIAITSTVDANNEYADLARVINCFDMSLTAKYISILLESNTEEIFKLLSSCANEHKNAFQNILVSLLTNESINLDRLKYFKKIIENNENIISEIPDDKFKLFIDNVSKSGIKFTSLTTLELCVNKLESIEKVQSYFLNVENVIYIAERLLNKKIYYGNLLSEIFSSEKLISTKKYIEEHFVDFVQDYIIKDFPDGRYRDSEKLVIKILTSNLSNDCLMNYANKNETIINDITLLNNIIGKNIVDVLFDKNAIKFTKENVYNYWDLTENYSNEFIGYIDRNITEENCKEILSASKVLCNIFINDYEISDNLFFFAIEYANEQIEEISPELSANRIESLIEHRLVKCDKRNIQLLLNKGYVNELSFLVNSSNEYDQKECVDQILDLEPEVDIVYTLINSNISDENALKLLNLIIDNVLIWKIDLKREKLIESVLDNKLSNENIKYILGIFETFKQKDKFISNLIHYNMLSNLDYNYLTDSFMKYILGGACASIDNKIELIKKVINKGTDLNQIKSYLRCVKEVSELATVWEAKHPAIDNEYKEKIAKVLNENNIVKLRKDNRLMLCKN